jgi:hypothetical protein
VALEQEVAGSRLPEHALVELELLHGHWRT